MNGVTPEHGHSNDGTAPVGQNEIHINVYHTLARQCESVVRATTRVNGETQNLTPHHAQTP